MRLEFSIYRYNPDVDDKPRMQDYSLEAEDGRDMMLLDALIRLKKRILRWLSVARAVKACADQMA